MKGKVLAASLLAASLSFSSIAHAEGGPLITSRPNYYGDVLSVTFLGFTATGLGIGLTGVGAGAAAYGIAITAGATEGVATTAGLAAGAVVAGAVATYIFATPAQSRSEVVAQLKEDAAIYLASDGEMASQLIGSVFKGLREDYKAKNGTELGTKITDAQIAQAVLEAS